MRRKRGIKKTLIVFIGCAFVFLGFLFLRVSMLNFPVLGPQNSLADAIREDFHLPLPPSVKVTNAARNAYIDPAYYYECTIVPSEIAPFLTALQTSSVAANYTVQDGPLIHFSVGPRPPAWYTPAAITDLLAFRVLLPAGTTHTSDTGYYFFFSPATSKLYVFWYST